MGNGSETMGEQANMGGTGDGANDADELARLLPGLGDTIKTAIWLIGKRKTDHNGWKIARAAELLLAERERLTARVAELESDLDDLHTRYAETMVAFDDAAPEALRALHKRQVDAQGLDATHGPDMAEKVRAALRRKPVATKGDA